MIQIPEAAWNSWPSSINPLVPEWLLPKTFSRSCGEKNQYATGQKHSPRGYHNSRANHAELSPLRTQVYLSQQVTLGHHCRRSGSISSWRLDCMSFRAFRHGLRNLCAPSTPIKWPSTIWTLQVPIFINPPDKGASLWGHWSSKATHSWLALSNQRTRSRTRSWNGVGRRGSRSLSEETGYQWSLQVNLESLTSSPLSSSTPYSVSSSFRKDGGDCEEVLLHVKERSLELF